jgi:uncharacterized protein YggT (Ycf19 family)
MSLVFLKSLVNLVISLVELIISLRIVLKLFGASQQASFVQWVYETSEPLLQPFIGMFPSPNVSGGFVIEFSALFGLLVYAFLGYILLDVLNTIVNPADRRE